MYDLTDRVALVTGAGSGLGKAQAERFAREGALVVAADLDLNAASQTAQAVSSAGGVCIPMELDVTDQGSADLCTAAVMERFGRIDVLSNTAGAFDGFAQLTETTRTVWDRVLSVNVTGLFVVSTAVVPRMRHAGRGVIINIASGAGLRGGGGGIAYTSSKHAVVGFTRQMAAAYGKDGIRVNAIAPGLIATPMTASFSGTDATARTLSRYPAGRVGRAEDIANVAAFLASDQADFIHAATIVVDGGMVDTFPAEPG